MSDAPKQLPLEVAQRIDQLCDAFEAAWQAGESPRIETYLSECPESARDAALRQLIEADEAVELIENWPLPETKREHVPGRPDTD